MVTLTMQINSDIYRQLTTIFEKYNLTFEEAIILFIEKTAKQGKLPFEYTETNVEEAKNNPIVTILSA